MTDIAAPLDNAPNRRSAAQRPSTNRHARPVRKYLEKHAQGSAIHSASVEEEFAHAVVIPSYGEDELLSRAVASIPCDPDGPVLGVIAINARKRSPETTLRANATALARMREQFPLQRQLDADTALHRAPFGCLALLHRVLPPGQGVGLARKFGVDFALGAWAAGRLANDWIHCTDADVILPDDYFARPSEAGAAMLMRFRHFALDPQLERSSRIYDAWLRCYVLGLRLAGSPYAYHTIGSTVAVNALHYAAVRGFPKRNAAEDFYLLNKLAKQGPIIRSPAAPIQLAARQSDRVPFGTGRTMRDAAHGGEDALPYFYDPVLFLYLRAVLHAAQDCITTGEAFKVAIRTHTNEEGLTAAPALIACRAMEVGTAIETAVRSAPKLERQIKAFHGWFDAFRTMKFLHSMRDAGLESQPWSAAAPGLGVLLETSGEWTADDRDVLRGALAEL